jgi:D-amino-acid oxidase
MQVASLRYYWKLARQDPSSGVQASEMSPCRLIRCIDRLSKTVTVREYWDRPEHDQSEEWYENAVPHFRRLRHDELPPGTKKGNTFMAISVDPDTYLEWIKTRLETVHGVRFMRATVKSFDEARQLLNTQILVNASGLGARDLAGDVEVVGVRGQTMFVDFPRDPGNPTRVIDKEVRIRRGLEYTYVLPRMLSGGVVIGGVEEEGSTDSRIDTALQHDILQRVNIMTGGWFKDLKLSEVKRNIAGIRPGRHGGYRVETQDQVVHAYGFGGAGYRYSVGAADIVVGMVDNLCPALARM